VGFEEVADGEWQVYFGPLRLGRFEEQSPRIIDANGGTSSRHLRRA
jgi:hypothetical protein